MRIFPIESMDKMLGSLGLEQGESITHPWVTKAIERAQARVEARNFDIRKNILKYDDVMNDQRKVIFEQRLELMDDDNVSETTNGMRHDVVDAIIARAIPDRSYPEQWDTEGLDTDAKNFLNIDLTSKAWAEEDDIDVEIVRERLIKLADEQAAAKVAKYSPQIMRSVEKQILLQSIDGLWRDHLVTLDHLSKVVGWRGLAQRDPLNEYKQEAYELFQKLLTDLRELVTSQLSHVEVQVRQPEPPPELDLRGLSEIHVDPTTGENDADSDFSGTSGGAAYTGGIAGSSAQRIAAAAGGVGTLEHDSDFDTDPRLRPVDPELLKGVSRNAPCPCGSGKKFKHCHGSF
jgi:preprotein translocase subunit SecA